jgi:hypothetical protein
MPEKTYFLDALKGGAGPGNRGSDFAVFTQAPVMGQGSTGEFKLFTIDWIKRGRPIQITIDLPDREDT